MKSSKWLAGLAVASTMLLSGCVPEHGRGDPYSYASVSIGTTIPLSGGHGHASIGQVHSYGGYGPTPCRHRGCGGHYPRYHRPYRY